MAWSVPAAGPHLEGTDENLPYTGSLSFWFKPTWSTPSYTGRVLFSAHYTATPQIFAIQPWTDGQIYAGWYNGGESRVIVANGNWTVTAGAWGHWAMTWENSTPNYTLLYLNNSVLGASTGFSPFDTSGVGGPLCIGAYPPSYWTGAGAEGDFAEFAIWDTLLSTDSISALSKGASPALVQPAGLWRYVPLWGRSDPDPDRITGEWAADDGVAYAEHPRMIYAARGEGSPSPVYVPPTGARGLWGGVFDSPVFGGVAVG